MMLPIEKLSRILGADIGILGQNTADLCGALCHQLCKFFDWSRPSRHADAPPNLLNALSFTFSSFSPFMTNDNGLSEYMIM
jgi:hypothetical protein